MNVLVPYVLAGGVPTPDGRMLSIDLLLEDVISEASSAYRGFVGLLTYPVEVWERFTLTARPREEPPAPGTLGIRGVPYAGRILVLPDPVEREGSYGVSFWRVGARDRLEALSEDVTAELEMTGPAETLRRVVAQGPRSLKGERASTSCMNKRSDLSCDTRDCVAPARCVPLSWREKGRIAYGCGCADPL